MSARFVQPTVALAMVTSTMSVSAHAEDWVMAGFIAPGDQRVANAIETVTAGTITIDIKEPGELASPLELGDAVVDGRANLAVTATSLLDLENSTLNLFTSVPFGPSAVEYLAWMSHGGGRALHDELLATMGLHGMPCEIVVAEASGWFREEITTTDQLQGLRMRIFGIGGEVLGKFGVEPVLTSFQGIKDAMQKGEVDAAEYSTPSADLWRSMHEVATHYYFPGWHQPATILDLVMSDATWQALGEPTRQQIESACAANLMAELLSGEAQQSAALQEIEAHGVQIHQWPPAMLDAFEAAWLEVVAEKSTQDKDFERVWQSLQDFRDGYAKWAALATFDYR